MFDKILIANRGEIACRIIRTARRMGIATVAVYSDADARALHVRQADEAVRIGPAPAAQSYLSTAAILEAVAGTGACAVHPGYGFLSENPSFAAALAAEGVVFIGPGVDAIGLMGDKIESRRVARDAGVAVTPGYDGVIADAEEAVRIARQIGYPVMIKAAAGGGGKGMRVAHDDAQAAEGVVAAAREAKSSFGDDRVFMEKYVTSPRHVEIQILADSHGGLMHLGERECSVQRRNQKVIEETPSPLLDAHTRQRMCSQALALARAVNYRSAGTVEFIAGADRTFYFLEMNTRLQVEHPITELVTGVDLVEQMIRVAAGERLPDSLLRLEPRGWAMESRIYAEDPRRGFLPSSGRLIRYRAPAQTRTAAVAVRNDTGVEEGSEVSVHYDPMIAKLSVWAPDRAGAIAAMSAALDQVCIDGIGHNTDFLAAVMEHDGFRRGDYTTHMIDETWPGGFQGTPLAPARARMFAAAAIFAGRLLHRRAVRAGRGGHPGSRPAPPPARVVARVDGAPFRAACHETGAVLHLRWLDDPGASSTLHSTWTPASLLFRAVMDGGSHVLRIAPRAEGFRLSCRGSSAHVTVRSVRADQLALRMPPPAPPDTASRLVCPMPGLVLSIPVEEGQDVRAGEPLAVIEAMKMENVLRAERDCTIARILCSPGDSLAVDEIIMDFSPPGGSPPPGA